MRSYVTGVIQLSRGVFPNCAGDFSGGNWIGSFIEMRETLGDIVLRNWWCSVVGLIYFLSFTKNRLCVHQVDMNEEFIIGTCRF